MPSGATGAKNTIQEMPTAEGTTPYEALYHIGYNEQQDVYVLHLLDTFGVGATCNVGVGKRGG